MTRANRLPIQGTYIKYIIELGQLQRPQGERRSKILIKKFQEPQKIKIKL